MTNFEFYKHNYKEAREAFIRKNNETELCKSGNDMLDRAFFNFLHEEHTSDIVDKLTLLREFLIFDIGIGNVYGQIGHDSGAVLDNIVNHYLDYEFGKISKTDIRNVNNHLKDIIKYGREKKFVDLIDQLIENFKKPDE